MVIMEIVQIVPDEIPECARRPKSFGLLKLPHYVRADSMIVNFSKIQKKRRFGKRLYQFFVHPQGFEPWTH